jgi:SIR2-like domain
MATFPEPPLLNDVLEIANKIRFARPADGMLGRVVFFVGAGCSISAGVPGSVDIARRMVREAAHRFECCGANSDCVEAYKSLVAGKYLASCMKKGREDREPTDETINWYKVYDELFRSHYAGPDYARELFDTLVSEIKGAINWAHLCLGELVAQKYVSTILTTNFDQLVLSGLVHAGVLPVMCDGIESLNRISGVPRHPQLVELHGSRHTYVLRNRPEDVAAVRNDPRASAAILELLRNTKTFVTIGYGGREEGVMDLLIQAAKACPDKDLIWVDHSPDPQSISDKVREFLATSKNGRLCPDQDADRFFLQLCKGLKVGSPLAISAPLEPAHRVIADVLKSNLVDKDIQAEINAAKNRMERLRTYDQSQKGDPGAAKASEIREKRLAGDPAGAYRLAEAWGWRKGWLMRQEPYLPPY